jgi:hypothetical protein
MRSIFGWSLPPGCSTLPGDIVERPQPRCFDCNAFLPFKPEKVEPWEQGYDCDGKVKCAKIEYDETEIRILGEEFRGKKYKVFYTDCEPEGCDEKTPNHGPHKVITWAGTTEYRTCKRCGNVNTNTEC